MLQCAVRPADGAFPLAKVCESLRSILLARKAAAAPRGVVPQVGAVGAPQVLSHSAPTQNPAGGLFVGTQLWVTQRVPSQSLPLCPLHPMQTAALLAFGYRRAPRVQGMGGDVGRGRGAWDTDVLPPRCEVMGSLSAHRLEC